MNSLNAVKSNSHDRSETKYGVNQPPSNLPLNHEHISRHQQVYTLQLQNIYYIVVFYCHFISVIVLEVFSDNIFNGGQDIVICN